MYDYFKKLFLDPSFMGSFLGALITGLTAILILGIQFLHQHKQLKKSRNENLYKYLKPIEIDLNNFLKEFDFFINVDNSDVNVLRNSIFLLNKDLKKVNEEKVTYEFYLFFQTMSNTIEQLSEQIKDDSNFNGNGDVELFKVYYFLLEQSNKDLQQKMRETEKVLKLSSTSHLEDIR